MDPMDVFKSALVVFGDYYGFRVALFLSVFVVSLVIYGIGNMKLTWINRRR